MLSLGPIVAQLRSAGFRSVDGVLEAPTQSDLPRSLPALFVIPAAEIAEPNRLSGKRDQRVTFDFSVLLTIATRIATEHISDELHDIENLIIRTIVGWTHPKACAPVDYLGGRLAHANSGNVTWEIRLRCTYNIRI